MLRGIHRNRLAAVLHGVFSRQCDFDAIGDFFHRGKMVCLAFQSIANLIQKCFVQFVVIDCEAMGVHRCDNDHVEGQKIAENAMIASCRSVSKRNEIGVAGLPALCAAANVSHRNGPRFHDGAKPLYGMNCVVEFINTNGDIRV